MLQIGNWKAMESGWVDGEACLEVEVDNILQSRSDRIGRACLTRLERDVLFTTKALPRWLINSAMLRITCCDQADEVQADFCHEEDVENARVEEVMLP